MKKQLRIGLVIANLCAISNLSFWLYMVLGSQKYGYPVGPVFYYWYIYYPNLMFPTAILLPFVFLVPIIVIVWGELRSVSPYTHFMKTPHAGWIPLALVFGCLISIAPFLIGSGSSTGELRHQASTKYEGHVYHLAELSRWSKTEDILYQCDGFGILCTTQFTIEVEERVTILNQLKER